MGERVVKWIHEAYGFYRMNQPNMDMLIQEIKRRLGIGGDHSDQKPNPVKERISIKAPPLRKIHRVMKKEVELSTTLASYIYRERIEEDNAATKSKALQARAWKEGIENLQHEGIIRLSNHSRIVRYVGKPLVQMATLESTLPHAMSSVTGKALKDSIRIPAKFNSARYEIGEIRWVPENGYKNLKVVVELDSEIAAEEACELELKWRHKSIGLLRIVTDRGLQVGDLALLDISATTIGDAEKIPSAESKGFCFDTEDADKVLPGLLDSIIGIQSGETKSFPLQFPESWRQENLRGVNALFQVECKELFYRELPECNDSIAERLLPGCSTLDQVKELLMQQCQELQQRAKEQATDNAILDQLRQMVEVDISQSLFEELLQIQVYGAKLLQIQANMKLKEEILASLTSPKAVNEYLEHEKKNIVEVIKQNLAVGDIFQRENLEFSTDELGKEVQNSIQELKAHQQEYDEERVKEQVQEVLKGAKVLEWLKQHADIQYITR